ncbi:hypothetical protein D3C72_1724480 [compost metagenome]
MVGVQPACAIDHMHVERPAGVEMPAFVRADAVPRRIRVIAEQVIDGRGGRARRAIGPADPRGVPVRLPVESPLRMGHKAEVLDQAVMGRGRLHGRKRPNRGRKTWTRRLLSMRSIGFVR